MINLVDYENKDILKVKLMNKNITLTKYDYILSDIDNSLDVVTKNMKLYFHQKYDLLIKNIKQNNLYNKLSGYYFIDHEEAFYHFFQFIDDADKEVFHLLNRLGIEDTGTNIIDWNSDVIKKEFYEEVVSVFEKIYNIDVKVNPKYEKIFNMSCCKYSEILYQNISGKYDHNLIDFDISKYNNEELFDYYNEIVDEVIDKSLIIYKNSMLLLIVDYLSQKDDAYDEIYEKLRNKDFINSFYDITHSKDEVKTLISIIVKYPFIVKNYYLISSYIEEKDYDNFKSIVDYLEITNTISETMNIDNHKFIYDNFTLDNCIDNYKNFVGLYCHITGEELDTYIARHMLLIQKEEIDKLLLMIEYEGSISRINSLFEQVIEKNKHFEKIHNKACISKSELDKLDRKITEQKSSIRKDNFFRTLMYLAALGFVIYEVIKLLNN